MRKQSRDHIKILIADNSEEIGARLFEIISEFERVEVVGVARSRVQALTVFNKYIPDGTLLDLHDCDLGGGQEILIALRELSHASIIIVLTNQQEMRQVCLRSGADCFLSKSHQFERVAELIGTLKEAIRN